MLFWAGSAHNWEEKLVVDQSFIPELEMRTTTVLFKLLYVILCSASRYTLAKAVVSITPLTQTEKTCQYFQAKCLSSFLEIHMIIIWGCFFYYAHFCSCGLLENKHSWEFIYLSINKSVHMRHRKKFSIFPLTASQIMCCLIAFCIIFAKVDNITAWIEIEGCKNIRLCFDMAERTNFTG